MPNLSAGDLIRIATYCQSGNQVAQNVSIWVVNSVVGGDYPLQGLAGPISSTIGPLHKGFMSSTAKYLGVRVNRFAPAASDSYSSVAAAGFGSNISDPMPGQVAALLSIRTGLAGRSNRGRKYIAFPPESYNSATGGLTNTALLQLALIGDFYTTRFESTVAGATLSLDPVILSRKLGVSQFSITYLMRENWATQRRRSFLERGDTPAVP